VVHKHDAVGVAALTADRDVLLVRQFRPPVRDSLLEIPAGLLDVDGEDALTCATRELFEETGFRHTSIEFMGGCYLSPGFTDEYVHLFRAETSSEPETEPEAGIELIRMPFERAVAAARDGKVRNASTALALLMAAARAPGP
jgi:ADP-ribose pyrophosphatase